LFDEPLLGCAGRFISPKLLGKLDTMARLHRAEI
jgi:hypothetical protein